jgi:4-hydroxy-tetrahydrodipicolinate synthase
MELFGIYVPLITPFKDGKVDEPGLKILVEHFIAEGATGLVPCGTTGESATMSVEEHERVVEIVVAQTAKRVPVIAGAGSNDTAEAISPATPKKPGPTPRFRSVPITIGLTRPE